MILPSDASDDQSNCPADYYRRSNGMLHQIPNEQPTPSPQIDPTALEAMSRDDLLALIKRMPGYPVALLNKDELAEAVLTRFAIEALDQKSKQWQPAGQQVLDRVKGKAVTPIAAAIQVKDDRPIDKPRLARELAFLNAMLENSGDGGGNGQTVLESLPNELLGGKVIEG